MKFTKGIAFIIALFLLTGVLAFADLIETFTWYPVLAPVDGKLTNATATAYTDTLKTTTADTGATGKSIGVYEYFNCMPIEDGFRLPVKLQSLYAFIVVQSGASDTAGTPPDVRWWVDMKDTVANAWKLMADTQRTSLSTEIGVSLVADTLQGYIHPDSISYAPFQVRIGLQSDTLDVGRLRVVDDTYLTPVFRTMR